MQFITESVILCLIGGAIGIVLGLGLGAALSKAVGYTARPSLAAIVIAVGFSMAIGVFFGITQPIKRRSWTRSRRCGMNKTPCLPLSLRPQRVSEPQPPKAALSA